MAPGSGTAAAAFAGFPLSQVPVTGKTGTAQRRPFQDTSWFAAIVRPARRPEHVIVAMVEQGGHGSTTAAPIVRSIIEDMYKLGRPARRRRWRRTDGPRRGARVGATNAGRSGTSIPCCW